MKKILFVLSLLIFTTPPAEAETLDFHGYYRVRWGGLDLAEMALSFKEAGNNYDYRADIYSRGLVRLFTDHKSHTKAQGKISGSLMPHSYDTVYTIRKKTKEIHLLYNSKAMVVRETFSPPRDKDSEAITEKQKQHTLDPLSLLGEVRYNINKFISPIHSPMLALTLYDGKRLMEVNVRYLGKATVRSGPQRVPAYKFSATRIPIAGFSEKELREYRKGEPPLIVYFSTDGRNLPIRLELDMQYGRIVAELERECPSAQACAISWDRAKQQPSR